MYKLCEHLLHINILYSAQCIVLDIGNMYILVNVTFWLELGYFKYKS